MTTLLIDAGNTSIKWAHLENGKLSVQQALLYKSQSSISIFDKLLRQNLITCNNVAMVSVLGKEFDHDARLITTKHSIPLNIIKSIKELAKVKNSYLEPHKLGTDRFVGMIAAYDLINNEKKGKKACIIIDSGTATTIDAIDQNGLHLGGLILPGVNLCTSSLLNNTQLLPQWNRPRIEITPTLFAKETTEAITSASILGLAGAIDNICNKMEKEIINQTPQSCVEKIFCGGNANQLLPYMDSHYQHQQNLLMIGLKVILENREEH